MTSYRADKPKVDGWTDGSNDITPSAEVPRGNDKVECVCRVEFSYTVQFNFHPVSIVIFILTNTFFVSISKLENLLYSKEQVLKVIDFGLASTFTPGALIECGGETSDFMSPEIIQQNYEGPASDVWALGVVFHILLKKEDPFEMYPFQVSSKIDGFIMIIIILIFV